jgi:hypothetical protein
MPILIAPTALPGLAHPEREIATAKAAGAAKTLATFDPFDHFDRGSHGGCHRARLVPALRV